MPFAGKPVPALSPPPFPPGSNPAHIASRQPVLSRALKCFLISCSSALLNMATHLTLAPAQLAPSRYSSPTADSPLLWDLSVESHQGKTCPSASPQPSPSLERDDSKESMDFPPGRLLMMSELARESCGWWRTSLTGMATD